MRKKQMELFLLFFILFLFFSYSFFSLPGETYKFGKFLGSFEYSPENVIVRLERFEYYLDSENSILVIYPIEDEWFLPSIFLSQSLEEISDAGKIVVFIAIYISNLD